MYLEAELQRYIEQSDVRRVICRSGDLECILSQFEDEGRGVDVLLNGLQNSPQSQHVT